MTELSLWLCPPLILSVLRSFVTDTLYIALAERESTNSETISENLTAKIRSGQATTSLADFPSLLSSVS